MMTPEISCLGLLVMEQASNNSSQRRWPLLGDEIVEQQCSSALKPESLWCSECLYDLSTRRIACVRLSLDLDSLLAAECGGIDRGRNDCRKPSRREIMKNAETAISAAYFSQRRTKL